MKRYIGFLPDQEAFATLVFTVEETSIPAARQAIRRCYKAQYGVSAPESFEVCLLPDTSEAHQITTLRTTHVSVEHEQRISNYTPTVEFV